MIVIDPVKYKQIINHVNLWHLKDKSIFITGGTGFFGLWLLNLLQILNDDGYNICVTLLSRDPQQFLDNNPEYKNAGWITWLEGDVVSYVAPNQYFDYFIHGAANTQLLSSDKQVEVFATIVLGAKHIFEHAVASKPKRVLLLSSGAVYGEVPKDIDFIAEDVDTAPLTNNPQHSLGEGKRAAEMFACCYAAEYGLDVVVARCFAFAGFGIREHLVLRQFTYQALHDDEIVIKGSGRARRSFMHGQDLGIWLLKLLIDGKAGEIYNVGSDEAYTIAELAEMIKEEYAPAKKISILGLNKQEYRLNYIPSIAKAKTLGLDVWTPLKEAIKAMK